MQLPVHPSEWRRARTHDLHRRRRDARAEMSFAVVILAGGEGRRIGGGKPDRLLGDESLIDRVIARARGWSADVAVAVGHGWRPAGQATALLEDQLGEGPIAGLCSALAFAADGGIGSVLTISCDTPFLPEDLPQRLLEAGRPAAVASSGGRLHPSCTLWRTEAAEQLPGYLAAGRSSLRGFAAAVGMAEVAWPVEPFDPFFNINTGDDLAIAERWLKRR